MGAETFATVGRGQNVAEAFENAVRRARYDYGHAGYTGTLAEKSSFTLIEMPNDFEQVIPSRDERVQRYADKLIEDCDPRIDDKWGPAGAIYLGGHDWLFFGWASS